MTSETTAGGTQILTPTVEEYERMLDVEVRAVTGESADGFRERYAAGSVDWSDPDAFYVAGLLGLNGASSEG